MGSAICVPVDTSQYPLYLDEMIAQIYAQRVFSMGKIVLVLVSVDFRPEMYRLA